MDNRRVYSEKISIDKNKVRDFYNRQIKKSETKSGAVLLGSQDPAVLQEKNAYCRDFIRPMLGVTSSTRVLDLGCGVGRWAQMLLPDCGFYFGVDFCEEMIKEAERICALAGGSFQLYCMSVADAAAKDVAFYGGKIDLMIISGVLMYLNDSDLGKIFQNLPNLLAPHSTVYMAESVGLECRLTLNDFPPEALQTTYNAIYRTPEEYLDFYSPLLDAGFSVAKREFMPKFGERYTDTGRYYTILKR